MILVLGGTYDSRKLTEALLEGGHQVIYSSVSDYNIAQLPDHPDLHLHVGALDKTEMRIFMREKSVDICVDATHPYASEVSLNAITVCKDEGCAYVRLERPRMQDDGQTTLGFPTYEQAVDYLAAQKGKILLTTGSRQLEAYQKLPKERLVIRVLPTSKVLQKCESLGYKPNQIIAMQGPFSFAMNVQMLQENAIRFMVTKDSGDIGGIAEKIKAAKECNVQVVFISRPAVDYPVVFNTIEPVIEWVGNQRNKNAGVSK